jgi:hypothetical protein
MKTLALIVTLSALAFTEAQAQLFPPPTSPDPLANTLLLGGPPSKPTSNTNTTANTAIGAYALITLTNGSGNIALGFGAGAGLVQGSNNTYIGAVAASNDMSLVRIGGAGQSNIVTSGAIVSGAGTNITTVLPSTGFTNNQTVGGTLYVPGTNGVVTLYMGAQGTNKVISTLGYIGGGNALFSFYLQNGWCVVGTNVTGTFVPGP